MDSKQLARTLNSVGMAVFVKYFYIFQKGDRAQAIDAIQEPFTTKSKKSRTSHALQIFAEQQELTALQLVLASSRTEQTTRENAWLVFETETGQKGKRPTLIL